MKTLRFFITLILAGYVCNSQTVSSNCSAPTNIINLYKDDADKFAMVNAFVNNTLYKDSIHLDKSSSKRFLKDLLAIYNATTLPGRDTVVLLNIHSTVYIVFNGILIKGDTTVTFLKNLKNGVSPTGLFSFDSLITKHYLKLGRYTPLGLGSYDLFEMKSDTNFNTIAMVDQMNRIAFGNTNRAIVNHIFGDIPNITDTVMANCREYTFSYGWDDCVAGCMNHRYWKFRVFDDCSVAYMGSYGSPITAQILYAAVPERITAELKVVVFPNPVKDFLNISADGTIEELSIMNIFGQPIYFQKEIRTEVDVSGFPKGIYFLKIKTNIGQKTFKILKE